MAAGNVHIVYSIQCMVNEAMCGTMIFGKVVGLGS